MLSSVLATTPRPACPAPRLRALLGAATLAATLLLSPLLTSATRAAIVGCGSDPVFELSNGTELDVNVTVDDDSSDVKGVTLTLHIPVGTSVVSYVAGSLGAVETWKVLDDTAAGSYQTVTFVTTGTHGISVTAITQAAGLIGAAAVTVSGQDHRNLVANVSM